MDNLTKPQRSYNMSQIRSTNTQLELKFFNLLDSNKIPYTKYPKVFGKPDCQLGKEILIFVDSDFWHGWNFSRWKNRMPQAYWVSKIENNIKRDRSKFRTLRKLDYSVIRVWEHELKTPQKVIDKIQQYLLV